MFTPITPIILGLVAEWNIICLGVRRGEKDDKIMLAHVPYI
jgi:hypothetical protein